MEHRELLARLIGAFGCQSYLEIGVASGRTFFHQQCPRKVAVDPDFALDLAEARRREPNSVFLEETSDAFFARHAGESGPFDLIFLDGLHTAEQIIRDLINATQCLSAQGVIVIDDVLPSSYAASIADREASEGLKARLGDSDPLWMGDVYKVVAFIAAFCQPFSFAAPLEAQNSLVVWRRPRAAGALGHLTLGELATLAFERTRLQAGFYNAMPLADLIAAVAADYGLGAPA
jgi:hypothetical protein